MLQPPTLKGRRPPPARRALDVLVVAAYGLILPQAMLDWPRHGAINIHASLLPRWRGAAPIQRALLAGDEETGISIMQMDAGLDTGPVIARTVVPIAPRDTAGTLTERLAAAGAEAIVQTLAALEHGGRARLAAPGRAGRDLCGQDRAGRSRDTLERRRGGDRPCRSRLQPGPRGFCDAARARRSRSGPPSRRRNASAPPAESSAPTAMACWSPAAAARCWCASCSAPAAGGSPPPRFSPDIRSWPARLSTWDPIELRRASRPSKQTRRPR